MDPANLSISATALAILIVVIGAVVGYQMIKTLEGLVLGVKIVLIPAVIIVAIQTWVYA